MERHDVLRYGSQVPPRIQYATTTDGVRIAYSTFGEGDGVPFAALRPELISHVEAEWRLPTDLFDRAVEEFLGGTVHAPTAAYAPEPATG
jgi:hypothetical protein